MSYLTLLAHAGHGESGLLAGLAHPLLGVDHLLAMVMVGLLAVRCGQRWALWMVPAIFVAGMLIGAAWSALAPMAGSVEWLVSGSVLAIGLILAVMPKQVLSWALPIVPLAGLFHGYAHLTEMAGHPAGYITGMVIATAVLHALGVAAGLGMSRLKSRYDLPARLAGGAITACFVVLMQMN